LSIPKENAMGVNGVPASCARERFITSPPRISKTENMSPGRVHWLWNASAEVVKLKSALYRGASAVHGDGTMLLKWL
jgi:hypothetical protein